MEDVNTIKIVEHGYLVEKDGKIEGVYEKMPKEYENEDIIDYGEHLVIPGMTDLHLHAPQYAYRGLGMDEELLNWLNKYAFAEESKYKDLAYAQKAYEIFVQDLVKTPTTRAVIFGTLHKEATLLLAKLLDESGMKTYVGKVNMDRNGTEDLEEKTTDSVKDTTWFVEQVLKECTNTKPIITPRFVPSCTDELMRQLSEIRKKYDLPVQSHLSENLSEIEWVKELNTKAKNYGDAYDMFGLFGGDHKNVMAHCVYSNQEEIELMKRNDVYVAHCPDSNMNIASGIAPIRKYLEEKMHVGLGSDVAGGATLSLFRAMEDAISVSKLYWRMVDQKVKPLTAKMAFYMATMGGGSFFGKVGSFLSGYEADIVVLDDSKHRSPYALSVEQRLERLIYLGESDVVMHKYVSGKKLF